MRCEIGVDLVEIARIQTLQERWGERFERRLFTPRELAYSTGKHAPTQSLAARFAAKEAVFKALGTGWNFGMRWRDVEVLNDARGKPEIRLAGKVLEFANRLQVTDIRVSLSHTEHYALAFVQMTFGA